MSETNNPIHEPIAVVGIGLMFPGATTVNEFWHNIVTGRDLIADVPATHWRVADYFDADPAVVDKVYCKRGAFLSPVEFPNLHFGVTATNLPATDTTQLLSLLVAEQVLADATQGDNHRLPKETTSVILGATMATELVTQLAARTQRPLWEQGLLDCGYSPEEARRCADHIASLMVPWQANSFPGALNNVTAGRIANRFDLGGTNCTVDGACASALAAISMAANELRCGTTKTAISGGVDTLNDIFGYMCFSRTPALSPTGDCRPFSNDADGTMLGEGIGMLALRRLADAERDGDRIYAVIRAIGSSSDGRAKSMFAPNSAGQARVLRRTYEGAGYSPKTVELMEAHGTATVTGDAAEVAALREVFEAGASDAIRCWCALGSIKSQIGHTKAAAGAAGLIKAILALHHKVLPPTIKVDRPNPKLKIDSSPFYLNTQSRPWVRGSDHPRRASVSSMGFGGTNFHIAVEEYTGPGSRPPRCRHLPAELVVLSDTSGKALAKRCAKLVGEIRTQQIVSIARKTQKAFSAGSARVAIVADSAANLANKLNSAAKRIGDGPEKAYSDSTGIYYGRGPSMGDVAFLFPGQGSQYIGMGADLAMAFEEAEAVWDIAADLPPIDDLHLHDVVFPRPCFDETERAAYEARLVRTQWIQAALAAVSISQLALLRALEIKPRCVGGHSFGEIVALHAAGVFGIKETIRIAFLRGKLMAEAARVPGGMLAVFSERPAVEPLLAMWPGQLVLANHNSPTQFVLSGDLNAITEAETWLKKAGLRFKRLPVATAYHTPLITGSVEPFYQYLQDVSFNAPEIPVYSNVSAAPHIPDQMRRQLADQLISPVRFAEQVEAMYATGIRTFVEVGAGRTLSGLVAQCLDKRPHRAIALDVKGQNGVVSFWHGLGQLVAAGSSVKFDLLWRAFEPVEAIIPKRASDATVTICGANRPNPNSCTHQETVVKPKVVMEKRESSSDRASRQMECCDPAAAADDTAHVLQVFQQMQRDAAEAHIAYQRATADAHVAFLKSIDSLSDAMAALATGQPLCRPGTSSIAGNNAEFVPPYEVQSTSSTKLPLMPDTPRDQGVKAATVGADFTTPQTQIQDQSADDAKMLIEIVSAKTGYPADALRLDQDLEADLGVDSIKRVEILAAFQERAEGLAELKASDIARLRTLAEVVDYMRTARGVQVAQGESPVLPPAPSPSSPSRASLAQSLFKIVAEKTGYPVSALNSEQEIEAGLGIDSIKRVEIFAALQERVTGLPEMRAADLARLRTLGDVLEYIQQPNVSANMPAEADPANRVTQPPPATILCPPSAATGMPNAIGSYVVHEVAAPPSGEIMPGLRDPDELIVTDEGRGIGQALCDLLQRQGIAVRLVSQVRSGTRKVIFLGGLKQFSDPAEARRENRLAFDVAQGVNSHASSRRLFVTVQDTGGDFALGGSAGVSAWSAGLPGLVKTLAHEWPDAAVKAIDIEGGQSVETLAGALANELLSGGPELEVGLHADGRRVTLAFAEKPLPEVLDGALPLDPDSVVVVTGGGRGVTARCVQAIAGAVRPRIVILGRSQLRNEPASFQALETEAELNRAILSEAEAMGVPLAPVDARRQAQDVLAQRELRETLQAVQSRGAKVRYFAVDVRDANAVAEILERVRRVWGPISAVIHGAGVLADRPIAEKTPEQFDFVFDTKVAGLQSLLSATRGDPLRIICLFSSVVALSGNAGQCDYAMANAVLNAVAATESRARTGCVVKSVNWGPWDGGMVTPSLRARFEEMGIPLISPAQGADALLHLLKSDHSIPTLIGFGAFPAQFLVQRDIRRNASAIAG